VPDSSDVESYGKGHLTFDCPWCGAISGVDPTHLGDSYECPECHEHTKLTDENTRRGHLAEATEDAPHPDEARHETSEWESYGKGAVTFDCPWCGAISGVDPSHIGQSFECPECHNKTKLTKENTRSTPVTEAPPDAPHHAAGSKTPLLVGAIGVVVVIVAAIIVLAGGGGEDQGTTPQPAPKDVALQPPPPEEPGPTEPGPGDVTPPDEAPPKEGPPDEAPPKEAPPDEAPPDETPPVEPQPDPVADAKAALEAAQKALADWETAHPGEMEVLRLRKVGADLSEQVKALLVAMRGDEVTPALARQFNTNMREFIAVDPQRIRVAQYLVTHLDRDGVKPHLLHGWEGLNFYAPRVREPLLEVCGAWGGAEIKDHADLLKTVEDAKAALEALEEGE